jgi:hypothetical protein
MRAAFVCTACERNTFCVGRERTQRRRARNSSFNKHVSRVRACECVRVCVCACVLLSIRRCIFFLLCFPTLRHHRIRLIRHVRGRCVYVCMCVWMLLSFESREDTHSWIQIKDNNYHVCLSCRLISGPFCFHISFI